MKKKSQNRFPVCRRGYDKDAVDGYIALEQAKADELQLEQRERINALKDENAKLQAEMAILKDREEQIKLALVSATENANKLNADVKVRYERELARLRLFRAKWINAYEQLKERYHFDKDALNAESVAVSVEIELKKMLAKDFALDKAPVEDEMEAHFRKEVDRLTRCEKERQKQCDIQDAQTLKKTLEQAEQKLKKSAQNSVAFSLDEALNPTESIEQNCQALSLAKR